MKKKVFSMLALLLLVATGAWAQEPTKYTVKMAEGTEDATKSEIGKAMKRMGFNSRKSHGTTKYLVIKIDPSTRKQECIDDAQEFIPDHF